MARLGAPLTQRVPPWMVFVRLLLALSVAVALLWGIELLRRQDPFARLAQQMAQSGLQNIELRLDEALITLREDRRVLATLQVERIEIEKSRIHWRAINLQRGTFYDEAGKPLGYATAREILYNQPMRRLHIPGTPTITLLQNPILVSASPLTIEAPMVDCDLRTMRLTIEQPFQLRWRDGSARAERLAYSFRERSLLIERGTIRLQTGEPPNRREVEVKFGSWYWDASGLQKGNELNFRDGDTTAYAPAAEVDNKRKYVIATGNLWLKDPRIDLAANKLELWYADNQKRAMLSQNVRLLIKPREQPNQQPAEGEEEDKLKEAKRYPVEAVCGQIEYFYRKKVAHITGGIRAIQRLKNGKQRLLTADRAEYDQKNEILTLIGNVTLEDPDGRFVVPRLIVSVKEGEEWVRAPEGGSGTVYYTEEEEGSGGQPPR